ncbi:hypothetical protein F5Y08DRAFT_299748 [Xylaria arbuscula]|nr:hypothetical protein F5Y08DRAFT_299748 [Xylaria arbuscula]
MPVLPGPTLGVLQYTTATAQHNILYHHLLLLLLLPQHLSFVVLLVIGRLVFLSSFCPSLSRPQHASRRTTLVSLTEALSFLTTSPPSPRAATNHPPYLSPNSTLPVA